MLGNHHVAETGFLRCDLDCHWLSAVQGGYAHVKQSVVRNPAAAKEVWQANLPDEDASIGVACVVAGVNADASKVRYVHLKRYINAETR